MLNNKIEVALQKFEVIIKSQLERVEQMKQQETAVDYSSLDTIVIGVVGGDGIGPAITAQAQRVLEYLLAEQVRNGKIKFKAIDGLTIENRVKVLKAIPDDVLTELKKCHVLLKGPTTTPQKGDGRPNIESANVAMRKALDLFANVRPVCVPELGIDWTFFRENTEGAYALGSQGFDLDEDIAFDFTVTTKQGSERIIRAAFEYAKKAGKTQVTAVTKANVIKTTDGNFLKVFNEIGAQYPDINRDEWYVDIMTAKLLDEKRRKEFQVIVLPNLYGDIITDEAAELQGGVGTAGGANIGDTYAMFEAIHGSAPRMVDEGRDIYADPSSIIRAAGMLLTHIGYTDKADKLAEALNICTNKEKKIILTGRNTGGTGIQFTDYLMETIAKL
ncbi:MAG: isocitrate/isopropylmalate dehydrogenase family protein [Nitrososphaerota archaeon]|jgi:isocitrate dehydrogenase (NAD+)|nr:isocitrate/isopropylmalate dehydrogenase family protein [Nitrososphaerota archaeon]